MFLTLNTAIHSTAVFIIKTIEPTELILVGITGRGLAKYQKL